MTYDFIAPNNIIKGYVDSEDDLAKALIEIVGQGGMNQEGVANAMLANTKVLSAKVGDVVSVGKGWKVRVKG